MVNIFKDKSFYKNLIIIVLPIVIQNAVTSFVSLLDNIMVGQIGTEAMSAVSSIKQCLYVFDVWSLFGSRYLCLPV